MRVVERRMEKSIEMMERRWWRELCSAGLRRGKISWPGSEGLSIKVLCKVNYFVFTKEVVFRNMGVILSHFVY